MKNGKIMFEKNVEKLQYMIPYKPIDIIIEDLCNNPMSDLDVNIYTVYNCQIFFIML